MVSPQRLRTVHPGETCCGRVVRLALGLSLLGLGMAGPRARAESVPAAGASTSPNQPEAIRVRGLPPPPCPLVVPAKEAMLQPLRIQPSQVPLKNRMGCLSAADAIYRSDGCPARLCGASGGMQLPPP